MDTYVYVDDSNIFMSCKEIYDKFARFDYSKFDKEFLSAGDLKRKLIVGATSSGNEDFYESMDRRGWEVKKCERKNAKEKRADTTIVCEAVQDIVNHEGVAKLLVMSGDLDFMPIVEKALEKEWEVEIWGFEGTISGDYYKYADVCVRHIGDYEGELVYFKREDGKGQESFQEHQLREAEEKRIRAEERAKLEREKAESLKKEQEEKNRKKKKVTGIGIGGALSIVATGVIFCIKKFK